MRISEFDYSLPPELIARYPSEQRTASRLLVLEGRAGAPGGELPEGSIRGSAERFTAGLRESRFSEIGRFLSPGDLMVFNDTRVIPARLFGRKATGGRVEILVERVLDERRMLAQVRAGKPPRPGMTIAITAPETTPPGATHPETTGAGAGSGMAAEAVDTGLRVRGRVGEFFVLEAIGGEGVRALLRARGTVPLPPYIRRPAEGFDAERYQTVYARREGAVAAPTAGLHFDEALLASLRARGIEFAFITLHVGAGTFSPVRAERVEDHRMHAEHLEVSAAACERIDRTRRRGGRVVAVGTTCARALETACRNGEARPFRGETDIFIHPGYRFGCVDALITNFHLPGSTLLMLVAAFAGRERILSAYRYAVERRFRFYSYGDAMVIFP